MHRNRKTPLSCGNKPGTNKSRNPKRPPGDHYRVDTLLKAIQEGSEKGFPPPPELERRRVPGRRENTTRWETPQEHRKRLGEDGWAAFLAWNAEHRFTSRQLRHNAATELRKKYGLDVTQTVLGHAMGSKVTAMVYAEAALDKALEAMAEVG